MPVRVTTESRGAPGGQQHIQVHLPAGLSTGALQLEVVQGGFISPSQVMDGVTITIVLMPTCFCTVLVRVLYCAASA